MRTLNGRICVSMLTVTLLAGSLVARGPALPAGLRAQLNRLAPGWRLSLPDADVVSFSQREWGLGAEALAVLRGDFDGDGRRDYAVHIVCGPGGAERRLVAFVRSGRGYRAHTLDTGEPTGQRYLRLARRGTTWVDYGTDRRITFRHDTIQLNVFEKSGASYVYDGGRFRRVTTAD